MQEVATGCFAIPSQGTPIAMDLLHANAGVSGQAIGAKVGGRHVIDNVWQPWWSAEPLASNPLGLLALEVAPYAAYDAGPWLQLGTRLRVTDASGAVILEDDAIFNVPDRDQAFVSIEFADAELARHLGLPPAGEAGMSADPFVLSVSWWRGKLSADLGSRRAGNTCPLSQAKTERPRCDPNAGRLVMGDDAVAEPRDLRAKLTPEFAPIDAITELERGPLQIVWPDGAAARLHVAYEPEGEVCVTEGDIHVQVSEYDAIKAPGYKVYIPLYATLRSEDGRLLVRMRGFAETLVAHDMSWDRHVDAALGYHELARLAETESPGFDVPHGGLAFLFGWLRTPMSDSEVPALDLTLCEPYSGVPPFPAVDETWSNRLGCYCARERRIEARIRPSADRSP